MCRKKYSYHGRYAFTEIRERHHYCRDKSSEKVDLAYNNTKYFVISLIYLIFFQPSIPLNLHLQSDEFLLKLAALVQLH